MAARAHDVAALSIKGNSAILNFPDLVDSLPRPASIAPRDIQVAANKAARMDIVQLATNSSSTSSLSSVLATELVLTSSEEDQLSEIVELPSLGTSYEENELRSDFVYIDSVEGWLYPPPWVEEWKDLTALTDCLFSNTSSSGEGLFWE